MCTDPLDHISVAWPASDVQALNAARIAGNFTPGSGRSIWWKGSCGHEWKDSINHRTSGRGCPQCRYERAKIARRKNIEDKQLNS